MLPGECVGSLTETCFDCRSEMEIKVCKSAAGFYLGFICPKCGPYSRESGYYPNMVEAQAALDSGAYHR
jgi:hypothetical protein